MWRLCFFIFMAILCGASSAAYAQTEPADNAIKNVIIDLDRFEGQAAGLDPSRASNIKRMQKLLGLTRQRLESSTNQSHASWTEADARLTALEQHLDALLTGGAPATAPAQAAEPPAPAEAPPVATPAETAPAETAPVAAPAETAPAAPATESADLSSLEKTALSRVRRAADSAKYAIESADPVALQGAEEPQRLRAKIEEVREQLVAIGKPGNPDIQAQAAQIDGLDALLDRQIQLAAQELTPEEREQVNALRQRIDTAWRAIKEVNVGALQQDGAVAEWMGGLEKLEGLHADLTKQDHPGVREAGQWLVEARAMLQEKIAFAEQYTAEYGNIPARYAAIRSKYAGENLPDPLGKPLTPESTKGWTETILTVMGDLDADTQYLQAVQPLNIIDGQQMSSAIFWVGTDSRRRLQTMLDEAAQFVRGTLTNIEHAAKFIEETDASDPNHVANRLLGEGQLEKTIQNLQEGLQDIAVAQAFDEALGEPGPTDLAALKARVEGAIVRVGELVEVALNEIRMPPSRASDPQLVDIAKDVLENPRYEVNGYERIVVSYDLNHREKKEGYITPGSVTTTVTVYHYIWDEFGATTAEKIGDKYYMHYNKFKKYESGDNTTPLNKWILASRFQSSQILEENIHE